MSLSKKQLVSVSAVAGFVIAAGALGWFLFDSVTVRGEQEEELAQQTSAFQRLNDAPVFPSKKTIAESKTNQIALVSWLEAARAYAARGDRKIAEETPPIFKQRLSKTVEKMRSLPGAAQGKIAVAGFQFGFDTYLGEGGVLPDVKDVPRLASQLDVIRHIVATLAKAGALEIKEIKRMEVVKVDEPQEKGKKKAAKKKSKEPEGPKPACLEFGVVFAARPDAIVKTLNSFSVDTRFLTVKDFAFKMTEDDIVVRMDADAAAKAAAAAAATAGTGRRRRRGGAAAAVPAAEAAALKTGGLIADPEGGSPLQVNLTLQAWDFGTGGNAAPAPAAAKPAAENVKKTNDAKPAAKKEGK